VQDQYRARDALVNYIKNKPKTESFALCVLSGPLRLVRGFTADENELLLAIRDKRAKPNASLISQMDQASLDMIRNFTHSNNNPQDLSRAFETSMAGLERSIEKEQLSQEEMRTHLTIDAFEQLARYLSGIPGRKNLVWLSAAFPLGKFAANGGLDAGPFQQERDFSTRVREAMNLLATAHVSVYPIDVRGVAVNAVFDAGSQTPFRQNLPNTPLTNPMGNGGTPSGLGQDSSTALNMTNDHVVPRPGAVEQSQEESVHRNSEHSAMDAIAEQTGGKAFYGTNDISDAVKRTVEQASDYYTLSYSPTNRTYDGGFRKIRLKLARRGYQVAYRAGYYADDPDRPPKNREALLKSLSMAGMTPGSPQSRQIPFEVRIVPVGAPKAGQPEAGTAKPDKDQDKDKNNTLSAAVKLQHYVVDFAISASQLRFEAGPEGNMHGRFQLLANSFDNDGRPMSRATSTASTEVKPADYGQVLTAGIRLRQELDVPAEASSLRLGVEDLTSPHIGTVELALPVPTPSDDPAGKKEKVLPPVEPD
jgi:VWFA-related protein